MLNKGFQHNSMTSYTFYIKGDGLKNYDFAKFFAIFSVIYNLAHTIRVPQVSN